jgi:heme/copper-type cytochrome/quinol oxidase subunit 2
MSTASAIYDGPGRQSGRSQQDESERAGQRLTLMLFVGIIVLATVGVTISAIANSMMSHHHVAAGTRATAAASAPEQISLYVAPEWKPGPEGARHDAFSKTNFTVKVGQPLRLTIDNRDTATHSITSAEAGVNIIVMPGVHTYTVVVRQAGHFKWVCAYECDPFSMTHIGYMQGYITAT